MQLRIPIVIAVAGTAVLVAGCGGAGKPSSSGSSAAGIPPASIVSAAYKYSRCMRQHGVSSFPDPQVVNSAGQHGLSIHITPAIVGSPQFAVARTACKGIMPGAGNSNAGPSPQQVAAHLKGLVSFADCMRQHGVSSFPDPTAQGQFTLQMINAAGINLHAPAVRTAARGCVPASDGQIPAASVNQALNGGS